MGLSFHLYGFILGLATLVSLQASLWLGKVRKIDQKVIDNLFVWVVLGGVIGARLYHVIDKWSEIYSLNPVSVFYLWNGGLGIWGAVIGGSVALCVLSKNKFTDLLDIAFFGLPLGQAIGRWGNFFNGEILGRNGEPLFLYESLLNLILFGTLFMTARRSRLSIVGIYLIGYGLIRLVLEPLRPEEIIWKIAGTPTAILASIIAIGVGSYLTWQRRS